MRSWYLSRNFVAYKADQAHARIEQAAATYVASTIVIAAIQGLLRDLLGGGYEISMAQVDPLIDAIQALVITCFGFSVRGNVLKSCCLGFIHMGAEASCGWAFLSPRGLYSLR